MGNASLEEFGWRKCVFDLPGRAKQTIERTFGKQSKAAEASVAHDDPQEDEADDNDEECDSCDGKGEEGDGEVRTLELEATCALPLGETRNVTKESLELKATLMMR